MHVHIFSGSEFAQYTIPSEQSPTLGLSYYKSKHVRLRIGGQRQRLVIAALGLTELAR